MLLRRLSRWHRIFYDCWLIVYDARQMLCRARCIDFESPNQFADVAILNDIELRKRSVEFPREMNHPAMIR